MDFEWDARKAEASRDKHGISFEEASTAFGDPLSLTIPDPLHSVDEPRYILIGRTASGRTVVVVHLDRGERVLIISARPATPRERRDYEEGADQVSEMRSEYDFSRGVRGKYA